MPLQPSPLLRGFEQGADGTDVWNRMMPGEERGPLTLDPQAVALGQQFQAIKAGIEAQQARPIWDQNNPVGTETVQSMGMPQPTVYAGRVGEFIDPATGQLTDKGKASLDNPMLGFDTGGLSGGGLLGSLKAYHGSPAKFAPVEGKPLGAFDDRFINTGEGAQAYGYGHYLAENEGVAQGYRKKLSGPRPDHTGEIAPEFKAALNAEDYLGFDSPRQAIAAMRTHPDWAERWDVQNPDALKAGLEAHDAAKYGGRGHM